MAQIEPMDIDIESDFDNKENTFHHGNVLSRTPCTEKGYEELDVSELNMKLRYSITPASSPMSKSLTGPCLDNRNYKPGEDYLNNTVGSENRNLTRSLNSTLTKTENVTKSKVLPLQTLSTDTFVDSNRNSSVRRLIEPDNNNVTISVSNAQYDENLSLPSTSSSMANTPEATTPTKEIPKPEGSPIMRGLKSVLSMFRPSQSPIPPADDKTQKQDILSPFESQLSTSAISKSEAPAILASTPVAANRHKDTNSSRRSSPLKESVVFNEDLEKELQWKDETTILFKQEKIPVHKLFFQNQVTSEVIKNATTEPLNTTVEYMDISCNETIAADRIMTDVEPRIPVKIEAAITGESDNEFLDCETTFTKNESCVSDYKELEVENKTKDIGDITVGLSENPQITEVNVSECKNIMNVTENINSSYVNVEQVSISVSDHVITALVQNSSNIVEATMGMLNSEEHSSLASQILNLNHDLKPKELNTTVDIDDIVVKKDDKVLDVINDNAPAIVEDKIDDLNLTTILGLQESLENIKIMGNELFSDGPIGNIGNLPDVCTVIINNVEYSKDTLPESCPVETSDNIKPALLNDEKVDTKNVIDDSACHNVAFKVADNNDQIASVPNNEVSVNSENRLVLFQEINPDLLRYNDNSMHVDSKENSNSIIHGSNTTGKDLPLTATSKSECDILMNVKDMIPTNITTESLLNAVPDVTNNDLEPKQTANVTFDTTNNAHIEGTVVNNENMNTSTNDNLKAHVIQNLRIESVNEMNTAVNKGVLIDNDREIPELCVGNDMLVKKSPSEVPLPDDDDIEQALSESHNLCVDTSIKQNVTFEICHDNLVVHTESESALEIRDDHARETENLKEEYYDSSPTTIITENNVENSENVLVRDCKELNDTQACNFNNQYEKNLECPNSEITEAGIIDMLTENLAHSETDSKIAISNVQIPLNNVQIENDSFNDKSVEVSDVNVDVGKITQNTCKTTDVLVDNVNVINIILNDTETNSAALKKDVNAVRLLNTDNANYVNDTSKLEDINQIKIYSNIQQEKEVQEIDEEILSSANNSPYVSVTDLVLDTKLAEEPLEIINNSVVTQTKSSSSPPISPKIISKGYNFNFDDIDDPFATKTKIRMSPTPDSPDQASSTLHKQVKKLEEVPKKVNSRRKSQPERKKLTQKKNINSSLTRQVPNKEIISEKNTDTQTTPKDVLDNIASSVLIQNVTDIIPENAIPVISPEEVQKENTICKSDTHIELNSTIQKEDTQQTDEEMKCLEQTVVVLNEKSTSSSEQYFSLGTSSGDSISLMHRSKNVFNLPEIDDMNFNPFATKSKMRMSPPPCGQNTTIEDTTQAIHATIDNNEGNLAFDKIAIKDCSSNISNTTCSSNNSNKDTTVREILTEDEDTIEGPFLEAEDLKLIEKVTDLDIENMMNFNEVSPQEKDENLDNGELFIDADAFEFLLNQNKSSTVLDSGKESLFLKFDPLFAKRVSSDGVLAALSKVQKRQSTPKKLTKPTQKDLTHIEKPEAGQSTDKENYVPVDEYSEDLSSTMTKPMMVVNPAVSSIVSPRRSATPPKLNRRSLTFTSPAMAVIDRLLSLSGNPSHLDQNSSIPLISREHTETDLAITQLRELLAEKEIHVHNLRSESKELKDRLADLEAQVRSLETESMERLAKINELNERLSEKTKINKSMATVVEEYERTIASLIAETEQDKKRNADERLRLIKERDEQTAHLTSMEVSFSDLHSKYEKSKQIILSCKANEDTYKKSIKEFEDNFSKMQNNYELLKQHATSKLNHANQELEKMNRAHEAEVLKLNAMIKRKDLHITSLEETLTQKTKANEELTAICDELINKVG